MIVYFILAHVYMHTNRRDDNLPGKNAASKSVQHSEWPETAEIGIQTRETSVRDLDREDLLELLRELVVTPRQHLDSVMELIEKELSRPDVSYNKMLRHVHEFSAIDVGCMFFDPC